MNAIATLQPSRLPIAPSVAKEFELKPTEWRVLVDQIFPSAKSVESVMMALAYCRKRNLDIFKKPVHIVPMWSSAKGQMVETVWPGIAEIRTTAARTGEYAGIDAVEFGPMVEREFTGTIGKGQREETVTKRVRFPEWASVVVYRMVHGARCAYHAKVFWEETYATMGKSDVPNEMWAKRPRGQIDKCVEAAALRKAFPEELGNTYVAEEMEGRTIEGTVEHAPAHQPPAPPKPPMPPSHQIEQAAPDVIDAETGEIVEEPEEQTTDQPDEREPASPSDMLTALDDELATVGTEELVWEVWESHDLEARLTHVQKGTEFIGIAKGIKDRHLKRVKGNGR